MESNKKFKITTIILSIIVVLLIIALTTGIIYYIKEKNTIKGNFDNSIPAIINEDNVSMKIRNKDEEIILSKGARVSILQDDILNQEFLIKYEEQYGTIDKTKVSCYQFDANDRYSLMLDVSQFNIVGSENKENPNKNFKTKEDFELFVLNNNIQYVYIRLGGRGWGKAGTLYYDDNAEIYIEACEYLRIPYGFYFLDEALNDEEITEEVDFVKEFLDKNNVKMNRLPLVLDLEYQKGSGRADNIWETRTELINKLIYEFNKIHINCLVYANGARIEKYIKNVNSKFWTAMYPQDDSIPDETYKATIKIKQLESTIEELNNIKTNSNSIINSTVNQGGTEKVYYSDEYLNKVVGWQFTESGAKNDGIKDYIDLSIVDNEYFREFVK